MLADSWDDPFATGPRYLVVRFEEMDCDACGLVCEGHEVEVGVDELSPVELRRFAAEGTEEQRAWAGHYLVHSEMAGATSSRIGESIEQELEHGWQDERSAA